MENKKIYKVGIRWSYYSEYDDNYGDFAKRFFEEETKAEMYFNELKERIKNGKYNKSNGEGCIYIQVYKLYMDECPIIREYKI